MGSVFEDLSADRNVCICVLISYESFPSSAKFSYRCSKAPFRLTSDSHASSEPYPECDVSSSALGLHHGR